MKGRPVSRAAGDCAWRRVERLIRTDIQSGALSPFDRLRSEKDMAAEHGVGLSAVRRALQDLKAAGLVVTKPKSGVFVADPPRLSRAQAHNVGAGLNVFDIIHHTTCNLRFTVAAWHPNNRAAWERVCRDATQLHPHLTIHPCFPETERDYSQACLESDVFMAAILDPSLHDGTRGDIEWLDPSELDGLPLESRHVAAMTMGGKVIGMPLSGTLLVGGINRARVTSDAERELRAARSWHEALPLLVSLGRPSSGQAGFNLQPTYTLNLYHYLSHVGGSLVDAADRRILLGRPDFRQALDALEALRPAIAKPPADLACWRPSDCCAYFDLTYQFSRLPSMQNLAPWVFPLGETGTYLENTNLAVISSATPYPEEARDFLRHLVSEPVQRALTALPGEHPVSTGIVDPFAAYPADWRQALREFQKRSTVSSEMVPGYSAFIATILMPLSGRFLRGELDAATLIRAVEERGTRFFARQAAGDGSPAAETPRPRQQANFERT